MPHDVLARADAIASNRSAGASELLAELLIVLEEAMAAGPAQVAAVARIVCRGQPAMAPLWNACAAAVRDAAVPGRFARVRAEMMRAPQALRRAASSALRDALMDVDTPQLLTLSYSASVAGVLRAIAEERALEVICAVSLPGGEGQRMHDELTAAGARASIVPDATLTTYLPSATAVVVGADALASRFWTNKAGTFGVAAAASYTGVPVYVIASRDKALAPALVERLAIPREFERTPVALATAFLTEIGAVGPDAMPEISARFADDVEALLQTL